MLLSLSFKTSLDINKLKFRKNSIIQNAPIHKVNVDVLNMAKHTMIKIAGNTNVNVNRSGLNLIFSITEFN